VQSTETIVKEENNQKTESESFSKSIEEENSSEYSYDIENETLIVNSVYSDKIKFAMDNLVKIYNSIHTNRKIWTRNKVKNGVLVFVRNVENETVVYAGIGTLSCDTNTVKQMVWDIKNRGEYDPMFKGGHKIQDLDENTQFCYSLYETKNCQNPGAFYYIMHKMQNQDGSITICAFSIDYDQRAQDQSVRGEIESSGFIIRPGKDSTCIVTYILQTKVEGLNQMLLNSICEQQIISISNIGKKK